MYELYNGDCLKEMDKLQDNSIDCIICDLPYGSTQCCWDSVLDLESLWVQYNRVAKKSCPIVLFGSQPFTSVLICSNLKMFREEVVWLKNKSGSGFLNGKRHTKTHENIVVFSKTGDFTFNPQTWKVEDKDFITHRKTFCQYTSGNSIYSPITRVRQVDTGVRNPISIISYAVPINPANTKTYSKDIDIRYHPTQKPIDLIDYLVKTYSNVGDTVLDNCMGSGTTGVACIRNKRNFIGIELQEDYFNIAKKRIEKEEIESNRKLF